MRKIDTLIAFAALAVVAVVAALAGYDPVASGGVAVITAMAVVQSSYSATMPIGAAGMAVNMNDWTTDSLICETADGIGFGLAVGQGTSHNEGVLGGALALFRGVSTRDVTLVNSVGDEYQQYDTMGVCFRGDVYVVASVDVLVTDPVHYDATTGIFKVSGGEGPIVGARWMKGGTAGAFCVLRLSGHVPVP